MRRLQVRDAHALITNAPSGDKPVLPDMREPRPERAALHASALAGLLSACVGLLFMAQGTRAQSLVGGAYIMPPASAPDLAGDVMEAIDKASGKRAGS